MRVLKNKVRLYSFIIVPMFVFGLVLLIARNFNFSDIGDTKLDVLASVSASFIGVLITVITIYMAVPKEKIILERMKKSGHEFIYLSNIGFGMLLYLISLLSWILFDSKFYSITLFVCGISNTLITIYYTFVLIQSVHMVDKRTQ